MAARAVPPAPNTSATSVVEGRGGRRGASSERMPSQSVFSPCRRLQTTDRNQEGNAVSTWPGSMNANDGSSSLSPIRKPDDGVDSANAHDRLAGGCEQRRHMLLQRDGDVATTEVRTSQRSLDIIER